MALLAPSTSLGLSLLFLPPLSFQFPSPSPKFLSLPKKNLPFNSVLSIPFALPTKNNLNHHHQSNDEAEDNDEEEDDDDDEDEAAASEYDDGTLLSMEESEEESLEEEEEDGVFDSGSLEATEEDKWERVERLLAQARELGDDIVDFDELAYIYDHPIDKFQRLAIQSFLRGSSVVVSAPTSSGKTLIAEAAAIATVAKGRRLFYTTPLKALSNQKFREFRKTFGENHCGLLTGDSSINKDAQILIMTTEILRNMLYQRLLTVNSFSSVINILCDIT